MSKKNIELTCVKTSIIQILVNRYLYQDGSTEEEIMGGVIFIDLRDVSGILQLVFDPENKELFLLRQKK